MKGKIKFTSIMVVISLLLCVVYGAVAVAYQYTTGQEISPTLTDKWFQVFGIEIAGTVAIYITKRITSIDKLKDKITLKKELGLEVTEKDFDQNNGYDYYSDDIDDGSYSDLG